MAQYYENHLSAPSINESARNPSASTKSHVLSEFDKLHETLLAEDAQEGWASELRHYLSTMEQNVTKETDLIEWWQVSNWYLSSLSSSGLNSIEPFTVIPNTWVYCAWCSPCPSVICSMWMAVLQNKANCRGLPVTLRPHHIWRTGHH